ncbi:hypothetical protein Trydic_g4670 [Trypoxylus dichotomus]
MHQELEQKITVARAEVKWSGQIKYLSMILNKRLTFSEHLKRARTRTIGRISQLSTHSPHPDLRQGSRHHPACQPIPPQSTKLRLVLQVPRRTALAALKVLADGENLQEFLNKLKRGFFEKTLVQEKPALKTVTTQKTYEATKHRTVKEEKPGNTRKTSKTQEDTQMPPASSRKEDIGGRRAEEESPANQ